MGGGAGARGEGRRGGGWAKVTDDGFNFSGGGLEGERSGRRDEKMKEEEASEKALD